MKYCENCNKEFKNYDRKSKFCSRKCSATYNNKKRPPKWRCSKCNSKEKPSKFAKICKQCLEKSKPERIAYEFTVAEVKLKHSQSNMYRPWTDTVRNYARSWIKNLNVCSICKYDKHTHLCHIKPIVEWPDASKMKEVNDISNIVFLCPNCHWEFDHGLLKIE